MGSEKTPANAAIFSRAPGGKDWETTAQLEMIEYIVLLKVNKDNASAIQETIFDHIAMRKTTSSLWKVVLSFSDIFSPWLNN